jgi:hypothetical protein
MDRVRIGNAIKLISSAVDYAEKAVRIFPKIGHSTDELNEAIDILEDLQMRLSLELDGEETDEAATESDAEAGFDLTDITAANWKKVLAKFSIDKKPKQTPKGWEWHGVGILIVTANDPITGKYYNGGRGDETDYASYIGISGSTLNVAIAFKLIKSLAADVKGYNATKREYI